MVVSICGHELNINEKLLEENGVQENLWDIIQTRLAISKLLLLEEVDEYYGKEAELMKELEDLEFKLQLYWGFPLDKNYHSYQWKLKHCSCGGGFLDGSGKAWINKDCPYHGK